MSCNNPAVADGSILRTPSPWSRGPDNGHQLRVQRARERHNKWDRQWVMVNKLREIVVVANNIGDHARIAEVKPKLIKLENKLMREMEEAEKMLQPDDADDEGGMNT